MYRINVFGVNVETGTVVIINHLHIYMYRGDCGCESDDAPPISPDTYCNTFIQLSMAMRHTAHIFIFGPTFREPISVPQWWL